MIEELAFKIIARCIRQDGPLTTPCAIWQGGKVGPGYGKIKYRGQEFMTHRVICEYMHGPIPEGCVAMHLCDNPSCCDPFHVKPATPKENVADAFAKGRRTYNNSSAKLTSVQVEQIKSQIAKGALTKVIAKHYGVKPSTIRAIKNGVTWQ